MSLMLEKQMVDPGWHQIHRYAYVKRPYEDVWPAVAADRTLVLPDGIRVGGTGPLQLRVRRAGIEVTRPVVVHIGGLVVEDGHSRLALAWWDQGHRNLFPVLEAVIELRPADFRGCGITQIGLVGRYRPPFGAFGSAVDLVAGAEIVAESVLRFVLGVAERIEAALPSAPVPDPEDGDRDLSVVTDRPEPPAPYRRVFLPVDGLACRSGGVPNARRQLAAVSGVSDVELDPLAGIAVVCYDPDRCTPEDLRLALEADAGQ